MENEVKDITHLRELVQNGIHDFIIIKGYWERDTRSVYIKNGHYLVFDWCFEQLCEIPEDALFNECFSGIGEALNNKQLFYIEATNKI